MPNAVEPTLIEPLFQSLQKERFVVVCTIDHETGAPNTSAISWVYAPTPDRLYFAVDQRSRIVANVQANPAISIVLIANESTYSISGKAHVKVEKLENVPLKLAAIQVDIEEVRDVMFYGAKISVEPKYEKTYDAQAAAKLDQQVMGALKQA
ncbi:pyridoxamine 5'-phosphate oxidase family protein [Anoxybacillus ayderensis]|uniref:pyridoxamine 5'-phosphate oxidase family protein n=1 Tax=Anoxybacillus ayderensis TaxID=265546 RepID=UPI0015EC7AB9|nr:pyridoxamine 5'-phosphate oxidase family protein [Anoxybacillus ayderensis]MBA2877831.1 flavin reductase (DIM6/NTAB) family NADH-FMN oxidoreductase RutF [Anoxybacillus ayderensis]MCL6617181.1 pyridoxamine 5'-phosphate oxidase family protein [Anoxybacillus ayderensis]MED0656589.1 pyridoxamine 5'-phosphate oxidase family protein [Anoxybacillus ayderensis]MED0685545.1 pyridoxamine 5'-phosphate oxidase family protein [Anoxybacillus ayderensis]